MSEALPSTFHVLSGHECTHVHVCSEEKMRPKEVRNLLKVIWLRSGRAGTHGDLPFPGHTKEGILALLLQGSPGLDPSLSLVPFSPL